ncbi:MAG: SDR family NAD(P)-dependent oxidoreductase, partial [Gemmatimonadales bacterium]
MAETVFITGATEGIGRALAFALGRAGYRVGVCARTEPRVLELLEALMAEGIPAAGAACDVADEAAVGATVSRVTAALGPVDVLVNNAGIAILKPFEELTTA